MRLAGDGQRTRFILDLDKNIPFRALALPDPYRVVVDLPQVTFQLAPGAGTTGRGLIKAFRYGLVMQGGSRIVIDTAGPVRVDKAFVLEATDGLEAIRLAEAHGWQHCAVSGNVDWNAVDWERENAFRGSIIDWAPRLALTYYGHP